MATPSGFFVGQVGALIRLDTQDDPVLLAAATVKKIFYKQPLTGITGAWTATLDGTKLTYTTTAVTDLPVPGEWRLQAYLEAPGWKLTGDVAVMLIEEPIKAIT